MVYRRKTQLRNWEKYRQRLCMSLFLSGFACLLSLLLSACSLVASTWQTGTLTNQHIHALAVAAKNPQVIYAGDVQGGIFVSTDAGQHWTARSSISTSPVMLLTLTPDPSGTKIYAATSSGLIISTDNAQSWHPVSSSILPIDTYTAPAFTSAKQVYIGTQHHGLFVSDNDASTWHSENGGLSSSIAINAVTYDEVQHRLWLATSNGIYRLNNGATSWQVMNTGFPAGTVATAIQPATNAGGDAPLLYAGTTKGFYLSSDSGVRWTGIAVLQYVYIRQILVDFRSRNAATVYVATNVGLFRSDDSGQNWAGIGSAIPRDQTVYALAIGAKQASQLYAVSNNVYLYPGNSSTGIDPLSVLSLLTVLLLFIILFYVARREIRRIRKKPQPPDKPEKQASSPAK